MAASEADDVATSNSEWGAFDTFYQLIKFV
jgi:hypothetical protein